MTDWPAVLSNAFHNARKKPGYTGDSGGADVKPLSVRAVSVGSRVTARKQAAGTAGTDERAVPVVPTPSGFAGDGPLNPDWLQVQHVGSRVPAVPGVTAEICYLRRPAIDRLRAMAPPESFGAERWRQLLVDADLFFQQWADRPELLDWSDIDLLGVHPRAPAARYDAMGLLLLLNGGTVIELHTDSATIRSRGGSLLVYRKKRHSLAMPPWQLG